MEKLKIAEGKAKKFTEAQTDAKRKQKMIQEKNRQIELLQNQLEQNKSKTLRVDKVMQQNADMVTRKCALETQVQTKDKKIQELNDKVKDLQQLCMQFELATGQTQTHNSIVYNRTDTNTSGRLLTNSSITHQQQVAGAINSTAPPQKKQFEHINSAKNDNLRALNEPGKKSDAPKKKAESAKAPAQRQLTEKKLDH